MAAPVVYRVPRRFITFPEDPPPYGFLAVSFLGHMLCFGAALMLSAFLGSRIDQSKVYIVNLVPAAPSLGSPAPDSPAPTVRAPVAPRPSPPVPKAEEKAPPKAARPEPPRPERPPERAIEPPTPPRAPEVAAVRPKPLEPSELALPRRAEKENPALPPPAPRATERILPPPPAVTPPVAAPLPPASPPRLPEPPRIAAPPAAPSVPVAPPATAAPSRPAAEPLRTGRPNAPSVSGSNLSVDASDFPFTYYLRQLHAKVSERWRRPPLVTTEQASAVIYFEIDREGQIRGDPKVKQTSGNELYDQSALRAVIDSVPFPPLPREFPGQYLKVNFGFDPGLNKG
jgi:TonB family protein